MKQARETMPLTDNTNKPSSLLQQNKNDVARTDLWWSTLTPQHVPKLYVRHDSISSIAQDTSIDMEEHCEQFCGRCTFWERIRNIFSGTPSMDPPTTQHQKRQIILSIFISVMLFTCLYFKSSVKVRWMVNVGETRRINTPFLSREMTITTSRTDRKSQLFVYQSGRQCPELSVTPVLFENNRTLVFNDTDYEYNIFYLNQGSHIHVQLLQTHGSSNAFLLRGKNMIQRVSNDAPRDNQGGFDKLALLRRALSAGDSATMDYRVDEADDYTLVYESASKKGGRLQVQYTVEATTYDVDNLQSVCHDPLSDCTIRLTMEKQCILIQSKPDASEEIGEAVIFVSVKAKHRIFLMLLVSLVPMAGAALHLCLLRWTHTPYLFDYETIGEVGENSVFDKETLFEPSIENSPLGTRFVVDPFAIPVHRSVDVTDHSGLMMPPSSVIHV